MVGVSQAGTVKGGSEQAGRTGNRCMVAGNTGRSG